MPELNQTSIIKRKDWLERLSEYGAITYMAISIFPQDLKENIIVTPQTLYYYLTGEFPSGQMRGYKEWFIQGLGELEAIGIIEVVSQIKGSYIINLEHLYLSCGYFNEDAKYDLFADEELQAMFKTNLNKPKVAQVFCKILELTRGAKWSTYTVRSMAYALSMDEKSLRKYLHWLEDCKAIYIHRYEERYSFDKSICNVVCLIKNKQHTIRDCKKYIKDLKAKRAMPSGRSNELVKNITQDLYEQETEKQYNKSAKSKGKTVWNDSDEPHEEVKRIQLYNGSFIDDDDPDF